MLFTGDAFELTNGIEKMINWNDARKLTADNTTLTQFGFSTKPQMISSNGNLMHWLSGDETTNQKIHVDVLKVPHHGSQVTTEPILFYHVSASVYLISGSSPTSGIQCPGRCVSSASLYTARLLAGHYFIKVKDIPS